jgi:hypothetical protein
MREKEEEEEEEERRRKKQMLGVREKERLYMQTQIQNHINLPPTF